MNVINEKYELILKMILVVWYGIKDVKIYVDIWWFVSVIDKVVIGLIKM